MQRSNSSHSYSVGDDEQLAIPRGSTLKKKASLRRSVSLRRSSSRRSHRAGSVRSLALESSTDPYVSSSAFFCPVPISGVPTDILAGRFQTWRKVLKDLVTYFREIQSHYEHRAKSLVRLAAVTTSITSPPAFLKTSGLDDALQHLRQYHAAAIQEANKSVDIEEDVILALTGLRSDLQQKIKEIKHLSSDFKNSVGREMDSTRKAVQILADALEKNEVDSASTTGKQDPYLLRLAIDRQVERQIDEENYLHQLRNQAYLNLEGSGRELESIVVGEIQKAHNAYAGILKREADNAYNVIEQLRDGPISMPKDQEWIHFVTHDDQIIDPTVPMRSPDQIHYPGQDHIAVQEIRAGLLERKSKYLMSYAAGWYVLSTTHLHEFKSADKTQAPVMSLYLPEQKLGSHSLEGGSSNKFILKGRQTGTMHRGHTWVFRAESHDTMMAWYEDIKALTENSPEERSRFVRTHSRSISRSSRHSVSSDGINDEEDDEPFSASHVDVVPETRPDSVSRRPEPGGRFPSEVQVNAQRGLQATQSPSSVSSGRYGQSLDDQIINTANFTTALAYTALNSSQLERTRHENVHMGYGGTVQTPMDDMPSQATLACKEAYNHEIYVHTKEPAHRPTSLQKSGGCFDTASTASQITTLPVGRLHVTGNEDDKVASKGVIRTCREKITEVETYGNPGIDTLRSNIAGHLALGRIENENDKGVYATTSSIRRSETHQESALPSAVEGDFPVEHGTSVGTLPADTPVTERPTDMRTTSTLSNLPMPGKYPKGNIATTFP